MWHLLQPIASLLVGLFLGAFGLIHSFRSFPGMLGFNAFVQSLPAISGVLLFAVGLKPCSMRRGVFSYRLFVVSH